MVFRKVKKIGKILSISMLLLIYAAWDFVANTVIGGALGTCVALVGMAYGVYQFIKHPELGLMGTLGAGIGIACLGLLPTIVKGLGMII